MEQNNFKNVRESHHRPDSKSFLKLSVHGIMTS